MLTQADLARHPIQVIARLRQFIPPSSIFHLSYYAYVPQALEDPRRHFAVEAAQLGIELFQRLLVETPNGMELAIHSNVSTLLGELHIPMVDLATPDECEISKVVAVLPGELAKRMEWYKSGRSFHGYGYALVSRLAWEQMMGSLLLANAPNSDPIVDPRWIGHRLLAGYAALRLTRNTDHYLAYPKLVVRAQTNFPYVSDRGPLS